MSGGKSLRNLRLFIAYFPPLTRGPSTAPLLHFKRHVPIQTQQPRISPTFSQGLELDIAYKCTQWRFMEWSMPSANVNPERGVYCILYRCLETSVAPSSSILDGLGRLNDHGQDREAGGCWDWTLSPVFSKDLTRAAMSLPCHQYHSCKIWDVVTISISFHVTNPFLMLYTSHLW